MSQTTPDHSAVREVVGVFDHEDKLEAAIDSLLSAGFDRAEISLLADASDVSRKLGYDDWTARTLEDDPRTPTIAYVSDQSRGEGEGAVLSVPMYIIGATAAGVTAAAGGPLAIALAATAAGVGAGAAIGAALAHLIGQHHVDHIEEQLQHGGLLIWVRAWNQEDEIRAREILEAKGARDVHVHEIGARPDAVTTPEALLASTQVSPENKVSILRQWAYDIREMLVAESEGMGECQGDLLSRIDHALAELGASSDPDASAPTLQGGS